MQRTVPEPDTSVLTRPVLSCPQREDHWPKWPIEPQDFPRTRGQFAAHYSNFQIWNSGQNGQRAKANTRTSKKSQAD